MQRFLLAFTLLLTSLRGYGGNKILYYFNKPVDNSVSTGVNAVYVSNRLGDTLIGYINRAKYTLDIAVYNFTNAGSVGPSIAAAVNNAHNRGVRVRWIYDGSQSNTGVPLLNAGIPRLASPTSSAYTIMHNKFMVVDANSANPNDAVVWTGSANWNTQQFNNDYNNVVVVQDSAFARAFRGHFNMMWGDTGMTPNSSLAKFGSFKTDQGKHNFTIEGKSVELYFSPADGTNTKILNAINSANKDLYFGMYTFTDNADASAIVSRNGSGVYAAGIIDQSSVTSSGSEYATLNAGLGSAKFKVLNSSNIYHNKYLIVDPSDRCSDPLVLTGSHNWTASANTKNDENTIIIHDDTAANIFYQSFKSDFQALSGALPALTGCPAGVVDAEQRPLEVVLHPNPSTGDVTINYSVAEAGLVQIDILDCMGKLISRHAEYAANNQAYTYHTSIALPALYYVRLSTGSSLWSSKILIVE